MKFLGEIEEEKVEEVKKRLREIKYKSFEAKLDKIGFFDNEDRGVVWVHITNCEELQKEIDETLSGLFGGVHSVPPHSTSQMKEKRFMSHLTIARTKNIHGKKKFLEELEKIKISPLEFHINEFVLKESIPLKQKHVYRDIGIYKLKI